MSDVDTELWTDKYRPRKRADIVGQAQQIADLCHWVEQYEKMTAETKPYIEKVQDARNQLAREQLKCEEKKMTKTQIKAQLKDLNEALDAANDELADVENNYGWLKRCVLIAGDAGVGKTSSTICVLESYGYQVHEFNASDVRTQSQVQESLFNLIHVKQVKNKKPIAIVMDEIDGMSGGPKGGLSEIIHYINPDRGKGNRRKQDREKRVPLPPMVCICNNVTERKLADFRKDCLELTFTKPNNKEVGMLLDRVTKAEKIKLEDDAREAIIDYAQGDFRRLVNYLQSLDSLIVNHEQILGVEDIAQCNFIIGEKTIDMGLEESVRFTLTNPQLDPNDCLRVYNNHKSQFVCSIYDNYIHLLSNQRKLNSLERIDRMAEIMSDIAWSDMIDKIMHKNQLWYLHRDHGLLSCYLPVLNLRCDDPILYTSSSRSKFNQQRNNEKDIYTLSSSLKSITGTTDVHILSQMILHYLLDDPTPENFQKAVKMLKKYGMDNTHVKTLIKIDRLSIHPKLTHRLDNALKDAFKTTKNQKAASS